MPPRKTIAHRIEDDIDNVLAEARKITALSDAINTIHRASEELAMRLAKPDERNHGRRYKLRVDAIRAALMKYNT
jgi:hypothetical protein